MLKSLQIENYAIIRSATIEFEDGFSVITGETGAGKSILLGALGLILGNRADTDVLYDKSKKCIVEATFNIKGLSLEDLFSTEDLDYLDETTIRREINENGKSRAFINDTPVNLNTLKTLVSKLIDVHSQHKTLMLQNSEFQLSLLDQFANNRAERDNYISVLKIWRGKKAEYQSLKKNHDESLSKLDYNNFVINELESAQLQPDEQEEIELKIKELSNAESIKLHLFGAQELLSDSENCNVLQLLGETVTHLQSVANVGKEYEEFCSRIDSLRADVQDLSYDISRKYSQTEVDPELLDVLNKRLDLLFTLQNKYHAKDNRELIALLEKYVDEKSKFTDNKEQLEALEREVAELDVQLHAFAAALSATRAKAAPEFSAAVVKMLGEVGLNGARFEVDLKQDATLKDSGVDSANFLFSANPGTGLSELSKTASGGEMSRIMLCLKSIITDSVLLPTVIFDEIDSGISGEISTRVANVMQRLAENHQVIAITHLPQIAARGKSHFSVVKKQSTVATTTEIYRLTDEERESTIAAMISGSHISDSARTAAREMLLNNI